MRDKVQKIDSKYYSVVEDEKDIVLSTTEKTNWDKMKVVSKEELSNAIFEDYDYLVLYKCPISFINSYSELFEKENDIKKASVYKIDKEIQKLVLCK